jgi:hypothetical protein
MSHRLLEDWRGMKGVMCSITRVEKILSKLAKRDQIADSMRLRIENPLNKPYPKLFKVAKSLNLTALFLPPKPVGLQTHCVKKGVFIHISTSPFPYPGDVGHHNHPLLEPSVPAGDPHRITPFLASHRVLASNPHGLVHAAPISG